MTETSIGQAAKQDRAESAAQARYPDLAGQVAVVTGGSRGIGAATAVALAANQVAVAVVGRDAAALAAVADAISESGGRAIWVAADCTVPDDLARMADAVIAQLGPRKSWLRSRAVTACRCRPRPRRQSTGARSSRLRP